MAVEGSPPPSYDDATALKDTENITLKYAFGTLSVYKGDMIVRRYKFVDDVTAHYLSWHRDDTAKLMLNLTLLLMGKSMDVKVSCYCVYDYTAFKSRETSIHICYNSVTKQISMCDYKSQQIIFTYYEHKHKQVFEHLYSDLYFIAGYKLDAMLKFKHTAIRILTNDPNINPQDFMAV